MESKNFMGVKLIGWFQLLGGFFVLLSLGTQQTPAFNIRFGVPFLPEILVKLCVGILAVIIAYGYLKYFKWGYLSMLIFSCLFCLISFTQALSQGSQPFIGNFIYSAIVVIYTLYRSKYFKVQDGLYKNYKII